MAPSRKARRGKMSRRSRGKKSTRRARKQKQRGGGQVDLYFNVSSGARSDSVVLVGHSNAPDFISTKTNWIIPTQNQKNYSPGTIKFPVHDLLNSVTNFSVSVGYGNGWTSRKLGVAGQKDAFSTEPQLSMLSSARSVTTPLNVPVNLSGLTLKNLWTGLGLATAGSGGLASEGHIKTLKPNTNVNLKVSFTVPDGVTQALTTQAPTKGRTTANIQAAMAAMAAMKK